MRKVYLYDTTLRDGAQSEGISYSVIDKVRIARKLDELGIHFIEGGWPGSNPKDMEFYLKLSKKKLKSSSMVAFGSTRRPNKKARNDKNLLALIKSKAKYITIFGKTWDLHVKEVLRISLDDNLKIIRESVNFLKQKGRKVFYDAEHFFDGYKANPSYALKTLQAAIDGGAQLIIFCDTNGGTLPSQIQRVAGKIKKDLLHESPLRMW